MAEPVRARRLTDQGAGGCSGLPGRTGTGCSSSWATQRRERARLRSERQQRRGRPKPGKRQSRPLCVTTSRAGPEPAQGII
jgi:hypothetical protein